MASLIITREKRGKRIQKCIKSFRFPNSKLFDNYLSHAINLNIVLQETMELK